MKPCAYCGEPCDGDTCDQLCTLRLENDRAEQREQEEQPTEADGWRLGAEGEGH